MTCSTAPATSVPIIDLSSFADDDDSNSNDTSSVTDQQRVVALQLRQACEQVGFFYITGHGCPPAVVTDMMEFLAKFFDLSLETKLEYEAHKNPLWRGYNSLETGAHSCTPEEAAARQAKDQKESFTIGAETSAAATISPMHGPNQWPDEEANKSIAGFGKAARNYWNNLMHPVATRLMKALAQSLELPQDFFTCRAKRSPHPQMVLLRYPPTPEEGCEDCQGCGAHTDCGFLTILTQDHEGLEVKGKDGSWIMAPPMENAFVVNLGDMMAHWTNDRYQSTEHRVSNPSTTVTRHSIPFFATVDYDTTIAPIPSCRDFRDGAVYEPCQSGEYILGKLGLMHLAKANKK